MYKVKLCKKHGHTKHGILEEMYSMNQWICDKCVFEVVKEETSSDSSAESE